MRIPDSLKLNKFVRCNLPSGRDLFAKLGLLSVGSPAQYSGDEEPLHNGNKIDVMADMLAYDAMKQCEEDSKKED